MRKYSKRVLKFICHKGKEEVLVCKLFKQTPYIYVYIQKVVSVLHLLFSGRINKMLSDYIDLPFGSDHELPWYPPVCEFPDQDDKSHRPLSLRQSDNNLLKVNDHLRRHLMKYVNGGKGEEAEIGQRIITAMHKVSQVCYLYYLCRDFTRSYQVFFRPK